MGKFRHLTICSFGLIEISLSDSGFEWVFFIARFVPVACYELAFRGRILTVLRHFRICTFGPTKIGLFPIWFQGNLDHCKVRTCGLIKISHSESYCRGEILSFHSSLVRIVPFRFGLFFNLTTIPFVSGFRESDELATPVNRCILSGMGFSSFFVRGFPVLRNKILSIS